MTMVCKALRNASIDMPVSCNMLVKLRRRGKLLTDQVRVEAEDRADHRQHAGGNDGPERDVEFLGAFGRHLRRREIALRRYREARAVRLLPIGRLTLAAAVGVGWPYGLGFWP